MDIHVFVDGNVTTRKVTKEDVLGFIPGAVIKNTGKLPGESLEHTLRGMSSKIRERGYGRARSFCLFKCKESTYRSCYSVFQK